MSAALVIDASITMAWCFNEEATLATTEVLDRLQHDSAVVPSLWFLEIANVLCLAERKSRIAPATRAQFIAKLQAFAFEVDEDWSARAFTHILPLAHAHRLTSYDAAYLDLAQRQRVPLATLDADLRAAAATLQVELLGL